MNSSYKLYGVFWDRKPIPSKKPEIRRNLKETSKVLLTEVLSRDSEKDINELISTNPAQVIIDFIPKDESKIPVDFYMKRLLQIVEYFHSEIVCVEQHKYIELQRLLTDFYNRKTPQRLLAQSDGVFQVIC